MHFELNLTRLSARLALLIAVLAGCSLLVVIVISRFVIGTLADDRLKVSRNMLLVPAQYFPGSARLNGRLAATELTESDRDLATAEQHARRAVNLSPYDYHFRLTLARVQEANGDRLAAEQSLEAARSLAPKYWDVNYRLANLLVREGKLAQSLDEFQIAVKGNENLLPGTLDLLWRASRGDVNAVQSVTGTNPRAKLALAQFLLKQQRPDDAANVFGNIDRSTRIASPAESSSFLNAMIAAGKLEIARDLWSDLVGSDRQSTIIWNGGFESDILKNFAQFDWLLARSEYASLSIDSSSSHGGSRSLRIEFVGRDTTQLDNEVKQLVLVRPGVRYTLECYAKTTDLITPEGPRVVIAEAGSSKWIAASEPVAQGSNDWRRLTVDFVAPTSTTESASAVYVSIKRKPKFSYDEPTRGAVWFDDFSMKQQ